MTSLASWKHRGNLYVKDNTTAESSVTDTPAKIAALATKGVESGLTVDAANNKITVANAGDYLVVANISFSGGGGDLFNVAIFKNTTNTDLHLNRMIGVGGDVGSGGVSGIVTCAAGDDISLYQYVDSGDSPSNMIVTDAQLSVVRLS